MAESEDLSAGKVTASEAVLPNFKADLLQRQDKRQRYVLCFSGTLTLLYAILFIILFSKIVSLLNDNKLAQADWHFFLFGSIMALIPAWMTSRLLNSVFHKEDTPESEITPLTGLLRHVTDSAHH